MHAEDGAAHVEWPSEKYIPTVTGLWPVAMSRRVIKSMACIRFAAIQWYIEGR